MSSKKIERKEFECKNCVPNKSFRMLVGSEVMQVRCDDCDEIVRIK